MILTADVSSVKIRLRSVGFQSGECGFRQSFVAVRVRKDREPILVSIVHFGSGDFHPHPDGRVKVMG